MQLFTDANKKELTEVIKNNDSLEVFWFPFNSIFDKNLTLSEGKLTLSKGIADKEISIGEIARVVTSATAGTWKWNPWNDDLWSREINFTTDKVTQE